MINLIPPYAKKNITVEYWFRVVTVWMVLFSMTLLVGLLIMLPTYVLVTSQVSAYKDSADLATEKIADFDNVAEILINSSQQARFIVDTAQGEELSEYVSLFESLQGDDISLSQISIKRGNEGIAPVELTGIASDRQELANFRDRLLGQETVSEIDFPISNLAKDKDIPFTLTVFIANQTES